MVAGGKRNRVNVEETTTGEGGRMSRNDIVIHPTLCHKLRVKEAKLQAHCLPWVT